MATFLHSLGLETAVKLLALMIVGSLDVWFQVLFQRRQQEQVKAVAPRPRGRRSCRHRQLQRIADRKRAAARQQRPAGQVLRQSASRRTARRRPSTRRS
ncbi:hypothetical protein [Streptomyces sp. NRRL S-350]|uniref:hypothetical protein n=1 Tax=Streptomyces sp. NRRL S-350 TaxID=1463902 RepID=UPI0004C177B6|nr:hypothetical protein [Streptomyces sp. NRRL S-350]